MESTTTNPARDLGSRTVALWVIIAVEVLLLGAPYKWLGVVGLSLLALAAVFGLLVAVLRGRVETVLVGWILIFPLGYYFMSFPREHPIITLDRFVIGLLLVSACFAGSRSPRISQPLRKSAAYWTAFVLFAALTIPLGKNLLGSARLWLEAFVFPAVLAWYVLRYVDVRRYLPVLHVVTCCMAIYVAALGAGEVILQRDLLPLPESGVLVAGDYAGDIHDAATQIVVRPNGPFSTVNSFAMIGMVSLFFLLFLRRALADTMPAWQRILHHLGVAAALAQALMPVFKSVIFSFAVIFLVDAYYQHGRRRILRVGAILGSASILLLVKMVLPAVFEERADPMTFYQRMAQQKQTLALALSHPIIGVGLNNFKETAEATATTSFGTGEALDSPHNNLGAVLAEMGITGFLPFIASQVFFVSAFQKMRRSNSKDSRLAWKSFLFVFLAFWINGMALTIIYFEDLNLWYMFVLAVIYKFAITSPETRTVTSREFAPQV